MLTISLKEIIKTAQSSNEQQWEATVDALRKYDGDEDDIVGARLFLESHDFSRVHFLEFISQLTSGLLVTHDSKLKKFPAWIMVAAATVIMATGLYINVDLQKKSLHIIETALPVYLSAEDDAGFNKAMALYKKGDYTHAAYLFNTIKTDTAEYYKAVCFEMLGFTNLSSETFHKIESQSEYYNLARMRLAVGHIEAGELAKASEMIYNIKASNSIESSRLQSIKVRLK